MSFHFMSFICSCILRGFLPLIHTAHTYSTLAFCITTLPYILRAGRWEPEALQGPPTAAPLATSLRPETQESLPWDWFLLFEARFHLSIQ